MFLISALVVAELSASMPDRFNPGVLIEKRAESFSDLI
jgi:hypothetical protein